MILSPASQKLESVFCPIYLPLPKVYQGTEKFPPRHDRPQVPRDGIITAQVSILEEVGSAFRYKPVGHVAVDEDCSSPPANQTNTVCTEEVIE
jgi:hypothetical protein